MSLSSVKEHMTIIGADGVHVGTVDKIEGDRIKLTRDDSGEGIVTAITTIDGNVVAEIEGDHAN